MAVPKAIRAARKKERRKRRMSCDKYYKKMGGEGERQGDTAGNFRGGKKKTRK